MLIFQGDNVLDPTSWIKNPNPVFQGNAKIMGQGHASFISNHKENVHWIVYHSKKFITDGWEREIRAKRFEWDPAEKPLFGEPQ